MNTTTRSARVSTMYSTKCLSPGYDTDWVANVEEVPPIYDK
jgi:hypothetical protein